MNFPSFKQFKSWTKSHFPKAQQIAFMRYLYLYYLWVVGPLQWKYLFLEDEWGLADGWGRIWLLMLLNFYNRRMGTFGICALRCPRTSSAAWEGWQHLSFFPLFLMNFNLHGML